MFAPIPSRLSDVMDEYHANQSLAFDDNAATQRTIHKPTHLIFKRSANLRGDSVTDDYGRDPPLWRYESSDRSPLHRKLNTRKIVVEEEKHVFDWTKELVKRLDDGERFCESVNGWFL